VCCKSVRAIASLSVRFCFLIPAMSRNPGDPATLVSSRAERREKPAEPSADRRVVERPRGSLLYETASGNSLKRRGRTCQCIFILTANAGNDIRRLSVPFPFVSIRVGYCVTGEGIAHGSASGKFLPELPRSMPTMLHPVYSITIVALPVT
jgi:hypothetical protein